MAVQKINSEEIYFGWWLDELQQAGLLHEHNAHPESFVIRDALPVYYEQHYRSNKPTIVKNFNLFQPITYTADRRVVFNATMADKLFGIIGNENLLLHDPKLEAGSVYDHVMFYGTFKSLIRVNGESMAEIFFDVKPPAAALRKSGKLGSSRDFPLKQRMLYETLNVYVNKVIPIGSKDCLFAKTFTPRRYLFQDSSGGVRKISKWKPRTLEAWLAIKGIEKPIIKQPE